MSDRPTLDPRLADVEHLMEALDAALWRLRRVHEEVDADTNGRIRHNDPNKAEISRDLLQASDLAAAVSTEMRMLYWSFKGRPDPRDGA